MNTEIGFDMMDKLLPYVAAVLEDDKVGEYKAALRQEKGDTGGIDVAAAMRSLLPLFLGPQRENMLHIAAIIAGKTVEEIKAQPLTDTVKLLHDGIMGDMMVFFASCLRMAMNA